MANQFIRQYELVFGVPLQITDDNFSTTKPAADKRIEIGKFIKESDANSYKISSHNISFNIEHSTSTGTKNNWIEINNLSDDIVSYVEDNVGDRLAIQLKAGYEDNIKIIFLGTIRKFSDDFSNPVRATRFDLEDGGVNLREAASKRSYPKGTIVDSIIADLLDDIAVPKASGGIVKLGDSVVVRSPFYVTGKTSTSLWQLCQDFNLNFSIINGAAYVVPRGKNSGVFVPLISNSTGLVGDITPVNEPRGKAKKKKKSNNKRWQFSCFLNGDITPMGLVKIDHPRYNGTYKVVKVTHAGSFEGGDWLSQVTIEEQKE